MQFNDVLAVSNYLPQASQAGPLSDDLINPTSSSSGVFGGNIVALQMDVDFSNAGFLQGTSGVRFGDLVLTGVRYSIRTVKFTGFAGCSS
jgi:hypothetical protein